MLYIKSTLIEDMASNFFPECIWYDVEIENENTLIGICYRCSSRNKLCDESLFELISKASFEKIMLMGD